MGKHDWVEALVFCVGGKRPWGVSEDGGYVKNDTSVLKRVAWGWGVGR